MATTVEVIGLKGFAGLRIFPGVTDTETDYSVTGTAMPLVGASDCVPNDKVNEFSIPGDDGIYASGSDWEYTDNEITVQQAELEIIAQLTGCEIDTTKKKIEEGTLQNAKLVALAYRALRRDGGYRCFRYYCAKLMSYSVAHKTKSTSNDGQSYKLKFRCYPRKIDNFVRGTEDTANLAAATAWLASIPTVTLTTP